MPEIKLIIEKTLLNGIVKPPASKSFTHRAIICASLSNKISKIYNPLICQDTLCTINAFKALGAEIYFKNGFIEIRGIGNNLNKKNSSCEINCKNSGSTMRFIIPICALLCNSAKITGSDGLLKRPIFPIIDALRQLNANIICNKEFPPVLIEKSDLKPNIIKIKGNISSQYISGLLFILPLLKEKTQIIITTEVESKNYILMTLDVLKKFGIKIHSSDDLKNFVIEPNQKYISVENLLIENDYSSAAFLFAGGVLAAKNQIIIKGLNENSLQGDRKIINILEQMNAKISFAENNFIVEKSNLKAVEIDAKDIPDLVPILCVIASQANGKTIIKNTERLKIKECNRSEAIVVNLRQMNANIIEKQNSIEIIGPAQLSGTIINPFDDHRIAMACTIAGFIAKSDTIIKNPVCIKKSYPDFFDDLRILGANLMPFFDGLGRKIKIAMYGDSHGKKIGVLISGISKNIKITNKDIQDEVDKRKSTSDLTTARKEQDKINIISGIENQYTNGKTIMIEIQNKNINSNAYESIKNTPRPGHADFVARQKYASVFDLSGGGFASGRMTAVMVAAGAIAKKVLQNKGVKICAYVKQIENIKLDKQICLNDILKNKKIIKKIKELKNKNDSVGGIVECIITGLPIGLGEPLFDSVESVISHSMFCIPAIKAIEFGSGFKSVQNYGSQNNDEFYFDGEGNVKTHTNNCGGILGGITNSMPVVFRVAVKPTSSIGIWQNTINIKTFQNVKIKIQGRHDPCIAIRVPPIVEAMAAISILDLFEQK
ncbi:MAG: hypothetical protein B6U87_01045 [Candidatus Aenigmarchaeota archaeon ex4484_52]|nr:MAG: hypothetical protein B6U87_01045 [Candidatus Aenigmarchaeota archaeon ex4484_52]